MRASARHVALVAAVLWATAPVMRTPAESIQVSATVPELSIGALECAPQPYNPTIGLLTTGFTLSRPCTVVVTFTDPLGAVVRVQTLAEAPAGPISVTWDGGDSAGVIVPPSWYLCSVSAVILGTPMQTSATHIVEVSYGSPLDMKPKGAAPAPFSPPGSTDISVVLSRDAQVSVTISATSAKGKVVRSEPTRLWFAGTNTYTWDGRDNGGKLVPKGTYYCTFRGVDSGGNVASVTQKVIKKK